MPSSKYPEGRIVTICNRRIVEVKDNTVAKLCGRLPFFYASASLVDDALWQEPIISKVAQAQTEREREINQIRRHADCVVDPPTLVQVNSGINKSVLRNTAGKVITYSPGSDRPSQWTPRPLPAYVINFLDAWTNVIYEKFCLTRKDLGAEPLSGESGRAYALSESASDGLITPYIVPTKHEWKEALTACIIISQLYYTPERAWTINGRHLPIETSRSWPEAIRPGWRVRIVNGSVFSKDPAVRLEQALKLKQQNPDYYTDPSTGMYDHHRFCMDAGIQPQMNSRDNRASSRAYAESVPDRVKDAIEGRGKMPTPRPYDPIWDILEAISGWMTSDGLSADETWYNAVQQLGMLYASVALQSGMQPTPAQAGFLPNLAAQPKQGNQGQGGQVPQGPSGVAPSGPIEAQAGQMIGGADQAGEQAAMSKSL
jgi:hypothetical protein